LRVLKSGVHATLAGVALGLIIPLNIKGKDVGSPLKQLEHTLHPFVSFAVLPIFAFANAGVSLKGLSLETFLQPITMGIMLGLFIGKQVGVMGMAFLMTRLKICKLPDHISWLQFYGMALLTGIGFTMSLFIGTLAFSDVEYASAVRLGVLSGSLLSGVAGVVVLLGSSKKT
ncbi:MAG: Na+/H+ antiporter NhaA, partial [Pseudomonadota bacterium]